MIVLSKTESIVISPNMKHVVTQHADDSLAIWDVDIDAKTIKFVNFDVNKIFSRGLRYKILELSNDKLLIFGGGYHKVIGTIEPHEEIEIHENWHAFDASFLPNGDLLTIYHRDIYVNSKETLKKSKNTCSYKLTCDVKMIKANRNVENNEIIFLISSRSKSLLQLNTKKMKIENYYDIPNVNHYMENVEGAVNVEGSLFAICYDDAITVFSMKNGISIASRKFKYGNQHPNMQFINIKNTEILMLHQYNNQERKIEYTIMSPYDLSYVYEGEYDLKEFSCDVAYKLKDNYMVIETLTQCLIMFPTENQIKLIDFNIPVNKLYDQMMHNHDLFLYSSFNDFKDVKIDKIDKSLSCEGKYLRWEYENRKLKVYKLGQMQVQQEIVFNSGNIQHLQILSNDDVILYEFYYNQHYINVFSFNETTKKIFHRYCYKIDELHEKKSLPNPSLVKIFEIKKDNISLQVTFLDFRKYFVEMIDEIINMAINKRMYANYEKTCEEFLDLLLNKLFENVERNYRIYDIFTKYLPVLNSYVPNVYSKFISLTSLIPNTIINIPDSTEQMKLVGYTCEGKVYSRREDDVMQRIFKINRFFRKFIHYEYYSLKRKTFIKFVVPYTGFTKYPPDYDYWKELYRPEKSPFVILVNETFCDSWNAEAIINFKWDKFGRLYYYLFWVYFTMYLLNFGIGSTLSPSIMNNDTRKAFLIVSIVLGLSLIVHEIRQFLWDPKKYIKDVWNWFDQIYNLDEPLQNADPNNPWNLVTKYQSVSPNDKINSETTLIQQPDSKLNQFSTYQTSLLAMYLFLTGDSSALSSWTYQENPFMTILLVMFSFLIVVYLMNLFIGLLNLEIENNRTHFLFMLEKAKILVEIELFFLLPNQRRWEHWFPDVLYYDVPIEDVQQKIKDIDNNPALYNSPYISDELRKKANLYVPKQEDLMSKTDYKDLVIRLDEIKTFLNLDKNVVEDGVKHKSEKSDVIVEIK
ncbi:16218_t:CDS:2 [Funneliformis caledonium]|uniref:16218_t:CDS:1 n=1 Tax=Funneliformis caledonium TaxID=1117310 RepID=A0A9N8Z8I7_9GLOM|nr:16218_t:CDS:2 [Funneliformis caledonium]